MKVKFRIFSKINVNGPSAHPIFVYLRANSILYDASKKTIQEIPWNFAKFLVDRNGKVVHLYNPDVAAESLDKDIQELLKWVIGKEEKKWKIMKIWTRFIWE